jgi:hypothetical protein
LLQHQELGVDSAFYDPLIAKLAGLIGWRMDMSDLKKFVCHCYANWYKYRTKNATKIKTHLLGHPIAVRLFQKALSVIWGATVKHYVERNKWPSIGAILSRRCTNVLPESIRLITTKESDTDLMVQKVKMKQTKKS